MSLISEIASNAILLLIGWHLCIFMFIMKWFLDDNNVSRFDALFGMVIMAATYGPQVFTEIIMYKLIRRIENKTYKEIYEWIAISAYVGFATIIPQLMLIGFNPMLMKLSFTFTVFTLTMSNQVFTIIFENVDK